MNRLGKVRRGIGLVRLVRNWPTAYAHRLNVRSPNGPVTYRLRDGATLTLVGGGASVRIVNEVWIDRCYEPNPSFAPRPGWVVLDIGANQGIFAVRTGRRGATVHAVEPEPGNLRLLRENLRRNGVAGDVHPVAVAERAGRVALHLDGGSSGRHSMVRPTANGGAVEVEATTLADVIGRIGVPIDLLKIDIEGAEYGVLAATPPDALAPVRRVVMEYHRTDEFGREDGAAWLVERLTSCGFSAAHDPTRVLVYGERPHSTTP